MGWYQDYASAGGGLIPLPPRANYYLGWRRYQDYASARDITQGHQRKKYTFENTNTIYKL